MNLSAFFVCFLRTPLHWACKRNHVSVVHQLLQEGANKDISNNDGQMPAQLSSNKDIRELLGGIETMFLLVFSIVF